MRDFDVISSAEKVAETQEWVDALEEVIEHQGKDRASDLINQLTDSFGISAGSLFTSYTNTIDVSSQPAYAGDLTLEKRIINMVRWNAAMMVLRAGKKFPELGGHISTFASSAVLYEVGFQHFFKAQDCVYFQGHASPGIYARAFLEGRLTREQLDRFRQEIGGGGLSSYPHPWLMPEFWQFPTVSMGLGPLQAIYQARFLRYLHNRGLTDTSDKKVWAFLGDGEVDEPESLGALSIAAREKLDNLVFVINCNLQRLDGPVRGNGKIIQELEGIFKGAGWEVIKIVWGSGWDSILAKDENGCLKKRMMEVVDGEYQTYRTKNGAYIREHFFNSPELKALVADLSDDDIWALQRGGLDPVKVHAAYTKMTQITGKPTVILAKTVKGYALGSGAGEGMNVAHNQKKMSSDAVKAFRDRLKISLSDEQAENLSYYLPEKNSAEMIYLQERRKHLGGALPARRAVSSVKLNLTALENDFAPLLEGSGEREISTTMAFVRIINHLMKDKHIGKHIVPIIPDESRTFGMEGMFRQYGIYSALGQLYVPADREQVMYYKEAKDGQLLEEGINEAGAFCSFIAAGTSYSVSDYPMVPFYIYYSMFGFQRIGDLAWAAADSRTKGFLIGGTAGRTTLAGEGLQHQDGHNLLFAATIPNCMAYDPCYSYEMAIIIQEGFKRMYQKDEDVFYYITAMNENYQHPGLPQNIDVNDLKKNILRGMYLFRKGELPKAKHEVVLLGSGTILREVLAAAEMLESEHQINAHVFSVTSFNELRRDALHVERDNWLHPEEKPKMSFVEKELDNYHCPVIAATDYMRSYADQIRAFVKQPYKVLGTDGFGRSDTRKNLREFFEVDRRFIVITAMKALCEQEKILPYKLTKALSHYQIHLDKPYSLSDVK